MESLLLVAEQRINKLISSATRALVSLFVHLALGMGTALVRFAGVVVGQIVGAAGIGNNESTVPRRNYLHAAFVVPTWSVSLENVGECLGYPGSVVLRGIKRTLDAWSTIKEN
mmetsp:Transcript_8868/g.17895  ORF Transcript_8868/g.17895 Transcript_8868/m.17895 type:complete len:113 (+) Transcript_8868:1584-1922(+)